LLGGLYFFLAHFRFCRCPNFLGSHTAKDIILGGRQPGKFNFLGSLFLADFAWRPAAKDHFLGGFAIFLGGFWPPRQFHFGVVLGCWCLDFQYCRIDAFEMTPEFMVLDYLGITLFHGWISDDDVLHSAIRGHTYKSLTQEVNSPSFQSELVEMALKFVTGPQLTMG